MYPKARIWKLNVITRDTYKILYKYMKYEHVKSKANALKRLVFVIKAKLITKITALRLH